MCTNNNELCMQALLCSNDYSPCNKVAEIFFSHFAEPPILEYRAIQYNTCREA